MPDRVICAGHVNWDVTLYVDRFPAPDGEARILDQYQSGGGSASNTAFVLAGLGLESVLLGSTGDDQYGSLVRTDLQEAGVDCTYLKQAASGTTTVKYLVVDETGQVAVLANDGANEAFGHETLPAGTLREAAHLHLTGQAPTTAERLAERAVEAGIPLSFDPGRRLGAREYDPVYRLADLVFLNESEAGVAREEGLFDSFHGVIAIKKGSEGSEALVDGEWLTHGGFDSESVDTSGAGDAFAAGFLAARLDDEPIETALAVGNACGALAAQSTGARTPITWADVESEMEN